MKKRVVVGMSGGVDSSVAAALLIDQGYEVIGITMCFNFADYPRKSPACCSIQGVEDARRVAHKLGIRHYILNMQKDLEERVIKDFCKSYLEGETPNPCVICNQYLKFGELLNKAKSFDAKFLATGHYARIARSRGGYLLKKAKDPKKDQTYFLYRLNQDKLKHIIFPLGGYTKEEVRSLARKFALPVAEKKASQEICFLPKDDYRAFLRERFGKKIAPGPVVDENGQVVGEHKGIAYYTIGQREGLGLARGHPVYITSIDFKKNRITIGPRESVFGSSFFVRDVHFALKPIKKRVALKVKIRYNHKESEAELFPIGKKIKVVFNKSQFAITPGQSAVFYDKNLVLGGGIIEKD
ncbi:MAG: tRNA 2-thiouridine(34) synthase MnmA [Candidatus Omnitrophica bacterium]|nr:tRNA 2-thiouridine(34) synthase MnmA [Candidatus Omnitrophota bacterium]